MPRTTTRALLEVHGLTYAQQAGIELRDDPGPLFQLLVLTQLASARIPAETAVNAARELFARGWTTPAGLGASTGRQRVQALGRAGYRRYDESTSVSLAALGAQVADLGGDLRRLRPRTAAEAGELPSRIVAFPRIGPVGAGVFCREVQAVWPEVRPYFDRRARGAAARLGWSDDPRRLAARVPPDQVATLAAALVRSSFPGAACPGARGGTG